MLPGVDANVRYNFRDTFHTEFLARGAGADENDSTVSIGTIVGSISTSIEWQRLDNRHRERHQLRGSARREHHQRQLRRSR